MDLNKTWKAVLAELELSVSKATFQTHFGQTSLISLENGVATIGFPNPLMRGLVENRYYSLVKSVLDHNTKQNTSLVFIVMPKKQVLLDRDAGPLFSQENQNSGNQTLDILRRLHVRPESTFDNFAVSTTNQMAYAAATAVAKNIGSAYNPLFFYGGVGVGKTHLMHAVANTLILKKHNAKIVYCMGEEFLNEIVEAIQTKTSAQFKKKYRSAELLMVDDVQFIAGKQTAQEEFFHTFNAVLREGGQVILTSDRPPGEISKLEDRLRSRFEGGLIVDISPPNFELRVAIVNIKSLAAGLTIPSDASQMIAANITDTRAIEGFIKKLRAATNDGKEAITIDLVTTTVGTKGKTAGIIQKPTKRVSGTDVLEAVGSYFDIKTATLKGTKRDRPIARPRQVVMYLCKTELGLTLEDIGGLLGGRDHTTVIHGVDTITTELSTNQQLREAVSGIKIRLWAQ
ncbi:chromosomal replication initiator protein DnaA [Candidatus Gottesmanbacteria bacterium]|nr:chromosomal replication initiator protein DnaA [Candidatus Gottesmanbacteria bacterium]